jgi:hypothetical protein
MENIMTKGLRRSEAEWQGIFQQQNDSGLSVVTYCQQHDLCSKTFYKHRRDVKAGKNTDLSSGGFIKIKKPSSPAPEAVCVLHYQNCKLQIQSNIDASWVARVMKALS